jgi:hypothetical protein
MCDVAVTNILKGAKMTSRSNDDGDDDDMSQDSSVV